MKHRRTHQSDQGGKDLFALQLRGSEDGLQRDAILLDDKRCYRLVK